MAANSIAKLSVILAANTGRFTTGMKQAESTADRFRAGMGKAVKAVSAVGVAMAGLAAGAMARLTQQGLRLVDSLAKASDRLGVTIDNLQAMRLAARLAGGSAEGLDQALFEMNKRLAEAAIGGGPAADMLESLGLNAEELMALGPAEAFRRISDAIAGLSSPAERANAAFRLFGRQGRDLLVLLQGGSAAIDRAAGDIDRFGANLSRVDAAKVEMANDAFTRIGIAVDAVKQQLAVQFAPLLVLVARLIGDINDQTSGAGRIAGAVLDYVVNLLIGGAFVLEKIVQSGKLIWNIVKAVVGIVGEAIASIFSGLVSLAEWIGIKLPDAVREFADSFVESSQKWTDAAVDSIGEISESLFSLESDWADGFERRLKDALREVESEAEDIADRAEKNQLSPFILPDLDDVRKAQDEIDRERQRQLEREKQERIRQAEQMGETLKRSIEEALQQFGAQAGLSSIAGIAAEVRRIASNQSRGLF